MMVTLSLLLPLAIDHGDAPLTVEEAERLLDAVVAHIAPELGAEARTVAEVRAAVTPRQDCARPETQVDAVLRSVGPDEGVVSVVARCAPTGCELRVALASDAGEWQPMVVDIPEPATLDGWLSAFRGLAPQDAPRVPHAAPLVLGFGDAAADAWRLETALTGVRSGPALLVFDTEGAVVHCEATTATSAEPICEATSGLLMPPSTADRRFVVRTQAVPPAAPPVLRLEGGPPGGDGVGACPGATGLGVQLAIRADGSVKRVKTDWPDKPDKALKRCVEEALLAATFVCPTGGPTTVSGTYQ